MYKVLHHCRVVLSIIVLITFTCIFIDIYGTLSYKLANLLHWQIAPAILGLGAGSLAILTVLLIITLFFGRVYCSILCPLGSLQDVVIRIAGWFKTKKQRRLAYRKPDNYWRYGILIGVIALFIAGNTALLLWLDPYSNYGRIAENLFKPITVSANNLAAHMWSSVPVYTMNEVTSSAIIAATVILLLVACFSIFRGRLWCNTVCPVGSLLGIISRYSVFRLGIDKEACTRCTLCEKQCKSQCIDIKIQQIDASRCVQCMNCMQTCKANAIAHKYIFTKNTKNKPEKTPGDPSHRRMFISSLAVLGTATAYRAIGNSLRIVPKNSKAIAPPGARSISELKHHCTACHACIANCPTRVIRPATGEYGIDGIMLPVMDYNLSFCNYECTTCSNVCPNGALIPLTTENKITTQIGKAVFFKERCIVDRDETDCGACDEHCPTKAVHMVPYKDGLRIPEVDSSLCIGCGGCEYICPARPRAIMVNGNLEHEVARKPEIQEQEQKEVDDFGF